MAHYLISYDLHNVRTYQPVWDKLAEWKAARLLESVWLVTLNNTASEVRDALQNVADSDDSIAVLELRPDSGWACLRAKEEGVNWLRAKIRR